MILISMVQIWLCLDWITKLQLVPPTMLPVVLSTQLNGSQSQPRNELMYQCQSLLRITTSKWVVSICSISLCSHKEFALGQRNGGSLSLHGWYKRFKDKCMEPFSHCTEAKNWYVRVPDRGCHESSGIFWKK